MSARPFRVAFISTHPPRECGIATFTADLCQALESAVELRMECLSVAMNDLEEGYPYPQRVVCTIKDDVVEDYQRAAEFLNSSGVDLVCLQHEYWIFAGPVGRNILALIERLQVPLVTTLHTVFETPEPELREVVVAIAEMSRRVVVLCRRAVCLLTQGYGIPSAKIAHVPHGVPSFSLENASDRKAKLGLEANKVILTFGLLVQAKGVEYMIDALPTLVSRHPDALYLVVGRTHPGLIRFEGEAYREKISRRIDELGITANVRLVDKFIDLDELGDLLVATDVFVTPYTSKTQISSGALTYAMGAGRATVSTPYWYAEEMLSDGRGVLVPFKNSAALGDAVSTLLADDGYRSLIGCRSRAFTRSMIWSEVASQYATIFRTAAI